MPSAGGVVIFRSPLGRSRLSVSLARAACSCMNTSCAVRNKRSPCSVRIRPRAWRWNSETASSCSSALTWRETADCDRPSCSPACVKLPASAAAWNTFSLSQSISVKPSLDRAIVLLPLFCRRAIAGAECEETFGLEGCHAAEAGGRDRLPVGFVSDVARGKQARYRGGGRIRRHLHIAGRFQLDLAFHQFGRRRVSDG